MGGPRQADVEADTDAVGRRLSCCSHVDHLMRLERRKTLRVALWVMARARFTRAANRLRRMGLMLCVASGRRREAHRN